MAFLQQKLRKKIFAILCAALSLASLSNPCWAAPSKNNSDYFVVLSQWLKFTSHSGVVVKARDLARGGEPVAIKLLERGPAVSFKHIYLHLLSFPLW